LSTRLYGAYAIEMPGTVPSGRGRPSMLNMSRSVCAVVAGVVKQGNAKARGAVRTIAAIEAIRVRIGSLQSASLWGGGHHLVVQVVEVCDRLAELLPGHTRGLCHQIDEERAIGGQNAEQCRPRSDGVEGMVPQIGLDSARLDLAIGAVSGG